MYAREDSRLRLCTGDASYCLLNFDETYDTSSVNLFVSIVYLIILFKLVFWINSTKVAKCVSNLFCL